MVLQAATMPEGNFIVQPDILLYVIEAAVVVDHGRIRLDIMRFFAGQVTAGVQRIDAHVHQRTAAGQLAVEPPLSGLQC